MPKKTASLQQRIDSYQNKIKELEARMREGTTTLTRESEGVQQALDALTFLKTKHKLPMACVIKSMSRMNRTGLRIQDPAPRIKKDHVA